MGIFTTDLRPAGMYFVAVLGTIGFTAVCLSNLFPYPHKSVTGYYTHWEKARRDSSKTAQLKIRVDGEARSISTALPRDLVEQLPENVLLTFHVGWHGVVAIDRDGTTLVSQSEYMKASRPRRLLMAAGCVAALSTIWWRFLEWRRTKSNLLGSDG